MLPTLINDMKTAMKNGKKSELNALRNLIGKIKSKQIDLGHDLNEQECIKLMRSSTKQLKESIKQYKIGGRIDLIKNEEYELSVIQKYLPQEMEEDEVRLIVKNIIKKLNANDIKHLGKVISSSIKSINGRADGSIIQKIVREELA